MQDANFLKVLLPEPEIGWMDLKTLKLNCLTLGELENEWGVPLKTKVKWKVLTVIEKQMCIYVCVWERI